MPSSRSEEHTSELQSHDNLVCRLLLEKKRKESRILPRPWAGDCTAWPGACEIAARPLLHSLPSAPGSVHTLPFYFVFFFFLKARPPPDFTPLPPPPLLPT